MMIFVLIAMLIAFVVYPNCSDRVFFEVFIGIIAINVLIAFRLLKYHWSVALTFLVVGLSGLVIMTFPQVYHRPLDLLSVFNLTSVMQRGYITFILISILPFLLSPEFFKAALGTLFFGAVFDSLWILGRTLLYGKTFSYAMLSNPAMDAAFIATMLPVAVEAMSKFRKTGLALIIAMLLAIIATRSSTGIGAVGVAFAAYMLIKYRVKALLLIVPATVAISGLGYLYLGKELLNPNGRYDLWWMDMKFFADETNIIWGAGSNSYSFWGNQIQMNDAIQRKVPEGTLVSTFPWMHNDWLQTLFENGLLGFLALLLMYICLLKFSWRKNDSLFPMICTFGFVALTQMPVHLFPFQILGVALIVMTYNKEALRI